MLPRLILVFLSVDWPIFSRRPMLTALAEAAKRYGTTVVAINRPLCPFSTFWRKRNRSIELLRPPSLRLVSDNLYLYSPKYFLFDRVANKLTICKNLNIYALRRSLTNLQARLGIVEASPLVWYYHPQQAYVTQIFDQSYNVFELYDSLANVQGQSDTVVKNWEIEWRSQVDLFLATSPRLLAAYGHGYVKSRFLKNGLTKENFLRLSSPGSEVGSEFDLIPHPRLGFAGVISERLDWKLILDLTQARPDWNLVFAGRVTDVRYRNLMSSRKNIYYLGDFPQNEISRIIAGFDVGIMPYVDTDFFRDSNPLKFYETCAAGVSSVASPMEILHEFPADVVQICTANVPDWISAIKVKLEADSSDTKRLCKQIASGHTWEVICPELLVDLESYLKHPSGSGSSPSSGKSN